MKLSGAPTVTDSTGADGDRTDLDPPGGAGEVTLRDAPLPERYQQRSPDRRDGPPRAPRHRRPAGHRRWPWLLLIPGLIGLFLLWSVLGAYTTPGNESFSAKWADWMRAHHAGSLVSKAEAAYYNAHQPAKGGAPKALNPLPKTAATGARTSSPTTVAGPQALPAPAAVPLVVSPALPGEGQWQPVGPMVAGQYGMYEAQFRADTTFTREITSAVWIDPKLMQISMIPGLTEPGGTWSHPPYVTNAELPKVAAAFNGGFRFQDAHGGFYLDGVTAVPLRAGAASLVVYKDGHVNVGAWGTEVSMTPDVVSVLQNLVPMVDNGQVSPSATYDDTRVWGATLGTSVVVARSGVGVTANGALVYVAGPALTARTLAEALQRAGAVRAMTLDINPEWVTFNFFSHTNPADPLAVSPTKLYPEMQRSSDRYLGPTQESRDFFEISAGPPA